MKLRRFSTSWVDKRCCKAYRRAISSRSEALSLRDNCRSLTSHVERALSDFSKCFNKLSDLETLIFARKRRAKTHIRIKGHGYTRTLNLFLQAISRTAQVASFLLERLSLLYAVVVARLWTGWRKCDVGKMSCTSIILSSVTLFLYCNIELAQPSP